MTKRNALFATRRHNSALLRVIKRNSKRVLSKPVVLLLERALNKGPIKSRLSKNVSIDIYPGSGRGKVVCVQRNIFDGETVHAEVIGFFRKINGAWEKF